MNEIRQVHHVDVVESSKCMNSSSTSHQNNRKCFKNSTLKSREYFLAELWF